MFPLYYRIFQRVETNLREYLSAIVPSAVASMIMALVLVLLRSELSAHWSLRVNLILLVTAGMLSYAGALLAFHRRRLIQLFRALRGMPGEQIHTNDPPDTVAGGQVR